MLEVPCCHDADYMMIANQWKGKSHKEESGSIEKIELHIESLLPPGKHAVICEIPVVCCQVYIG